MSDSTGSDTGREGSMDGVRRRRRSRLWALIGVAVVAVAVAVFLAVEDSQAVTLGAISPAPQALVKARPATISCELTRYVPGRGSVTVTVDGVPIPAADITLREGQVQASVDLADGEHSIAVAYESSNVFSRHVDRSWAFVVDTTSPTVVVDGPSSFPRLTARSSSVRFSLSEPATVSLALDGVDVPCDAGEAATTADGTIVTAEGTHVLALTARDMAGNVATQQWDLVVDYKAPVIECEGLPDAEVWNDLNSAAVVFTVSDHFADQLRLTATLDGAALALQERTGLSADMRAFAFDTGILAEGTHTVLVSAADPGGHIATFERRFLVDTSSVFGSRTLKAGAIGEDVKQLQRILKIKGAYDGDPTGLLDESTAAAVAVFNAQHDIAGGEVVTEQTLDHLLGRIRIDLSERKLYLYDGDGQVVKTYRVAVGMPAHPTPTGEFRIITKVRNPIWNPPDSAWAAGMGPVPPGPSNPLGTRWMGLNSPGIGIHGTPAPSTIGTAASHGCIRMKIPEAEDLFDRVYVGTPVAIVP